MYTCEEDNGKPNRKVGSRLKQLLTKSRTLMINKYRQKPDFPCQPHSNYSAIVLQLLWTCAMMS